MSGTGGIESQITYSDGPLECFVEDTVDVLDALGRQTGLVSAGLAHGVVEALDCRRDQRVEFDGSQSWVNMILDLALVRFHRPGPDVV